MEDQIKMSYMHLIRNPDGENIENEINEMYE